MSNPSLFVTLFCKWPKTRRSRVYFWRIFALVAGLIFFTRLFILVNRVPTKMVDLDVTSYDVWDSKIELLLSLGKNTDLRERFDSTYKNAFKKSGREGLVTVIEASTSNGFPFLNEELPIGGTIGDYFPNDISDLEGISGMLQFHLKIDDVHRKPWMFNTTRPFITDTLVKEYPIDSVKYRSYLLHGAEVSRRWHDDIVRFESNDFVSFKDTNSIIVQVERTIGESSFFHNHSIWQGSDISQEYVGIHLSKTLHQMYRHDLKDYAELSPRFMQLSMSVDFGSPVTLSTMEPAPDSLFMTGFSFYSEDKIKKIINDGLVFHVTYDENKNLQAVKLFWITTIIAALLGILLNQAFKWWKHIVQKRRLEKRLKARIQKSDGGDDSKTE